MCVCVCVCVCIYGVDSLISIFLQKMTDKYLIFCFYWSNLVGDDDDDDMYIYIYSLSVKSIWSLSKNVFLILKVLCLMKQVKYIHGFI